MNVTTDTPSELFNLDSMRLSQLSRAKVAVALNNVHHVQMSKTYDYKEHVTMYVLDVFLQSAPRGLLSQNATVLVTKSAQRNSVLEREIHSPDFQVEHRYSSFRSLRKRIREAVAVPSDKSHSQWCPYCSRVREIVTSRVFPSRFPNGNWAIATGLRDVLVRNREKRLESFVNLLLRAAKDISYRSGCDPCVKFEVVSALLSDFLSEPHSRTVTSSW
ncbi:Phox homologous domain [Plasmopara halstedii]|uniref:Phox homologous domain n=1 Tax=Plasmopara halstedii TaxID=4781 RepID=A0A0P1AEC9_PLAHL|nr:Phox homologous domain [Plasmopara halstedii]CEG38934.1 Phox homologous domain [Plasmopara halstedii]|eukprot:XP_024575303.1 Phox homologous domain [Plasmopara halstedii]